MNPLRLVAKKAFDDTLNTDGPRHTFMRLCTSSHVDDLQGVATFALLTMVVLALIAVLDPEGLKEQIGIYTAVLVTVAGTISWAYQSGGRRLGAVDLFASEISAICRVCLVVDFAKASVARAIEEAQQEALQVENEAAALGAQRAVSDEPKFTSAEEYTPVYDKNIADLQSLDFDVVKCVTNFYTYRKTMMDLMRRIAVLSDLDARRVAQTQMIYMQYLMYESGRHAVDQLIEFEPDKSECIINVLCSEFVLYGFLKKSYGSEFRGQRLDLRLPEYETLVAEISRNVKNNRHKAWERARTTEPELVARYEAMRATLTA